MEDDEETVMSLHAGRLPPLGNPGLDVGRLPPIGNPTRAPRHEATVSSRQCPVLGTSSVCHRDGAGARAACFQGGHQSLHASVAGFHRWTRDVPRCESTTA